MKHPIYYLDVFSPDKMTTRTAKADIFLRVQKMKDKFMLKK